MCLQSQRTSTLSGYLSQTCGRVLPGVALHASLRGPLASNSVRTGHTAALATRPARLRCCLPEGVCCLLRAGARAGEVLWAGATPAQGASLERAGQRPGGSIRQVGGRKPARPHGVRNNTQHSKVACLTAATIPPPGADL